MSDKKPPVSDRELADIKKISPEQGFLGVYLEERGSFPNFSHEYVLRRAKQAWYLPTL
jgi:hypothetical protein